MKKKNIVFFVNFEKTIFFREIEKKLVKNVNSFWISGKPRWTNWLTKQGVKKENIVDITFSRNDQKKFILHKNYSTSRIELLSIEKSLRITFNYLISMDRRLRYEPYDFALDYLIFVYMKLKTFYRDNNIDVIFGETTHAAEALAAELAPFLNVRHYHICQLTIPGNRFGFFEGFSIDRLTELSKFDESQKVNWLTHARELLNQKFKPFTFVFFTKVPKFKFNFITKFFKHLLNFNLFKNGDQTAITLFPIIINKLKRIINYFLEKHFIKFYDMQVSNNYLLYLMQRQPEATIDLYGGYYSNQTELIKNISRACPSTHDIFIKLHPNGMGEFPFFELYKISKLNRVKLIKYSEESLDLIKNCSCVITVSGTAGIEASILGKPVFLLSDVYYERLNGVSRINNFNELRESIVEITTKNEQFEFIESDKELNYLYENSFEGIIGDPVTTVGVTENENISKVVKGVKTILNL